MLDISGKLFLQEKIRLDIFLLEKFRSNIRPSSFIQERRHVVMYSIFLAFSQKAHSTYCISVINSPGVSFSKPAFEGELFKKGS